jgi:hypothetical protein
MSRHLPGSEGQTDIPGKHTKARESMVYARTSHYLGEAETLHIYANEVAGKNLESYNLHWSV